ncbi:hypothetical protein BDZ97DRAFT_2023145 [Flammula alnicola]|nr:hypothetical protein BDZ97DRAFT_2023145 [Flammula alnicola]
MSPKSLPNFGRPEGVRAPASIDHLPKYWDKDEEKDVVLIVTTPPKLPNTTRTLSPHDNHWMIVWEVGEIITGPDATRIPMSRNFRLGMMTFDQRRRLEEIANTTEVLEPNGQWNCQDWILTVLETAQASGIITREQWVGAVSEAQHYVGNIEE